MRLAITVAIILPSIFATSCGVLGKKKNNSSKAPNGEFQLTGDEQKSFDTWKQAPIKSCTTANAFESGVPERDDRAIDLRVLLVKTSNSLVLRNGIEFVILDSPRGLGGKSTSELTRSTEINGDSSKFGAKMTRSGSHCKVEVNGEVVHETFLFAAFPVLAHGQGTITEPKPSRHLVEQHEDGLLSHGLIDSFVAARVRESELNAQLKNFFSGWSDDDLKQFFPGTTTDWGNSFVTHTAQLDEGGTLPFVNASFPQLPSIVPGWQTYADVTGETTYKILIPALKIKKGDISNSADQGLWQLEVSVSWHPDTSNTRLYEVKSITWRDPLAEDPARLAACFHQRYDAFASSKIYGEGRFSPSYGGVVGPCTALGSDADAVLYADDEARSLVRRMFSGVTGGNTGVRYNGWDEALKDFALRTIEVGDDIQAKLDPSKVSPLIASIAKYATPVASQVVKYETIRNERTHYVSSLAFPWAFQGLDVNLALVPRAIQAIASMVDPFDASVNAWLQDLAKDPGSQSDQINFSINVSDATKQAVRDLVTKAVELGVDGVFVDSKLPRVIQDRIDVSGQLEGWRATLDALASFRARDAAKVNEMSKLLFDSKFSALAEASIKEDWRATEFERSEIIASFAHKKSFCNQYADATTLIDCAGGALFSRKKGALLDPDFGDRYAVLAREFAGFHDKLADPDHVFIRQDLENDFFKPVWKACDAGRFASNRQKLSTSIDKLLKSDVMSRFDVQNEIRSLLDECDD